MLAAICKPAVVPAGFGTGGTPVSLHGSVSPDHFLLGKRSSWEHSYSCLVSFVEVVRLDLLSVPEESCVLLGTLLIHSHPAYVRALLHFQ